MYMLEYLCKGFAKENSACSTQYTTELNARICSSTFEQSKTSKDYIINKDLKSEYTGVYFSLFILIWPPAEVKKIYTNKAEGQQ